MSKSNFRLEIANQLTFVWYQKVVLIRKIIDHGLVLENMYLSQEKTFSSKIISVIEKYREIKKEYTCEIFDNFIIGTNTLRYTCKKKK